MRSVEEGGEWKISSMSSLLCTPIQHPQRPKSCRCTWAFRPVTFPSLCSVQSQPAGLLFKADALPSSLFQTLTLHAHPSTPPPSLLPCKHSSYWTDRRAPPSPGASAPQPFTVCLFCSLKPVLFLVYFLCHVLKLCAS